MGYNTGVFILNDAFGGIQKDPKAFVDAILVGMGDRSRRTIRAGSYGSAAEVFHCEHADRHVPYVIGGNCMQKLLSPGEGLNIRTSMPDDDMRLHILKQLADELGYTVSKKRKT